MWNPNFDPALFLPPQGRYFVAKKPYLEYKSKISNSIRKILDSILKIWKNPETLLCATRSHATL